MQMVNVHLTVLMQVMTSMLLLSSCSGGNSAEGDLTAADCTPTTTTSTDLEIQVAADGSITLVPVADNTVSGCESPSETGERLDSSLITTRFENTEDFDVWDCVRTDGSSLYYALLSYDDFTHLAWTRYAFEIIPDAADLTASQQLYGWVVPRSPDADMLTIGTRERVGRANRGETVEGTWTDIMFATEDNMSFTSSTKGAMQCNRTISSVDLAASQFDIPCEFRGPVSAC